MVTTHKVKIGPTKLLIDNEWVENASGHQFEIINFATGEAICDVAEANAADVDRAVEATRQAFTSGDWSKNRNLDRHCEWAS